MTNSNVQIVEDSIADDASFPKLYSIEQNLEGEVNDENIESKKEITPTFLSIEEIKERGGHAEFKCGQPTLLSDEDLLKLGQELADLNGSWMNEDKFRAHHTAIASSHKKAGDAIREQMEDVARQIKTKRSPQDGDFWFIPDDLANVQYVYDVHGNYCDTITMSAKDKQQKISFDPLSDENSSDDVSNETNFNYDNSHISNVNFDESDENDLDY